MLKPDPPNLNYSKSMYAGESIANVPYDFWDINGKGIKDPDEPWSYDDWFYSDQTAAVQEYIRLNGGGSVNGTQKNVNDVGGRLPDSEDLNGNGALDIENDYFSISFDLGAEPDNNPLILGGNRNSSWWLYRIPLTGEYVEEIGQPDPDQLSTARIWFDQLPSGTSEIAIASIEFIE